MLLYVFVFVTIKCKKCKMVGDLNTMFSVPCLLYAVRCLFDIMSPVLKQAESEAYLTPLSMRTVSPISISLRWWHLLFREISL